MRNPMEDLNLQWYDVILVCRISGDLQNICNFVPMNTVSERRRLFINMVCKPKILFLQKTHTRGLDLCWKIMWTPNLILLVLLSQMLLLQMLLRNRWQHSKHLNKYYTVTIREPEKSPYRNYHFLLEEDLNFMLTKWGICQPRQNAQLLALMGMLCVLLASLTQWNE